MKKLLKILSFILLIFTFSACTEESNDTEMDQEMNDGNGNGNDNNNDNNNNDLFTGTKVFDTSGYGTDTLTVASFCKYPFTSVTENLELTLNFENGIIISGTYDLDIKTEVGNPVSAEDVVCNFDPTFNENHTGDLTISSNEGISFSTNIGTSNNLTGVIYAFNGTATENSYSGTVKHSSPALSETIEYELDSETISTKKTFNTSGNGTGTLTVASFCKYPFTSVTEDLELTLKFENGTIISGTYDLDIKTEVGTPVSAENVVCNFDPTFNENHTGDLTISSDEGISFSTNIGTSNNLTGVTYTFDGTATEDSYSGTVKHASPSLDETVTYDLSSETILE